VKLLIYDQDQKERAGMMSIGVKTAVLPVWFKPPVKFAANMWQRRLLSSLSLGMTSIRRVGRNNYFVFRGKRL